MTTRKATIYTVAERAGVSIATVSRTLAGSPKVAPETRQRVMQVIEALNYHPNPSARGLARKRTETIALVFPSLSGPYYSAVMSGVEQEAGRHDYNVLIYGTHGKENSARYLRMLASKVDGLVVLARSVEHECLRSLWREGIPLVLLGWPSDEIICDSVAVDNYGGAYGAAAHLLGHGHRRIAIIAGPENSPDSHGRLQGYRRALHDAGISIPQRFILSGNFLYEGGRIAMQQLLEATSPPTAVLAANDEMAMGAIDLASERGLQVPDDLAVIGFDDIPTAALVRPALTTVRQPMQLLGETAAKLLFDRLRRPEAPPRREVLETKLIVRQSCGCSIPFTDRS